MGGKPWMNYVTETRAEGGRRRAVTISNLQENNLQEVMDSDFKYGRPLKYGKDQRQCLDLTMG
jgi:hypothetical protein